MTGRRGRDDATANVLPVLVVGTLLIAGSFAFTLDAITGAADPEAATPAQDGALARAAAITLTRTPGVPADWHEAHAVRGVDAIARLGLRASDAVDARTLDPRKLDALRGGSGAPLSGEDVARLLGMDPGTHVRVRVTPVVQPTVDGAQPLMGGTRVGYVGQAGLLGTAADAPVALSERRVLAGLGVTFDDTDAHVDAHVLTGDVHRDDAAHLARTLALRLAGFAGAASVDVDGVPVHGEDYWKIIRAGDADASWHAWWTRDADAGTPPPRVLTFGGRVTGDRFDPVPGTYALTVVELDLRALADAPHAGHVNLRHHVDPAQARTALPDDTGLIGETEVVVPVDTAEVTWTCLAACPEGMVGEDVPVHTFDAPRGSRGAFATDALPLPDDVLGSKGLLRFTYTRGAPDLVDGDLIAGEGWFISEVNVTLTHDVNGASVTRVAYANTLDHAQSDTDVLVVGSDVDHTALTGTEPVLPRALSDWLDAGGRLLVLGSARADAGWLPEALGSTVVPTLGAPHAVPAPGATDHPLLRLPYTLDPGAHDHAPWTLARLDGFRDVLVDASTGTPLLVERPRDDAWDATLVVAAARPGATVDKTEGAHALANWVTRLALADAYVHGGDALPAGHGASTSAAPAMLPRGDGRASVPVTVTVHAWR